MAKEYADKVLKSAVAQLCILIGWQNSSMSALNVSSDITKRFLSRLGSLAASYAETACRQDGNMDDLGLAFKTMGIQITDLQDYVKNVSQPKCAEKIFGFPVPDESSHIFESKLGTTKEITEDGNSSDDESVIPSYLPPVPGKQAFMNGDQIEDVIVNENDGAVDNDIKPNETSLGVTGLPQCNHKRLRSFSIDEDESSRSLTSPPAIDSRAFSENRGLSSSNFDETLKQSSTDTKYLFDQSNSSKGLPKPGKHPLTTFSSGRPRKDKSKVVETGKLEVVSEIPNMTPPLKIKLPQRVKEPTIWEEEGAVVSKEVSPIFESFCKNSQSSKIGLPGMQLDKVHGVISDCAGKPMEEKDTQEPSINRTEFQAEEKFSSDLHMRELPEDPLIQSPSSELPIQGVSTDCALPENNPSSEEIDIEVESLPEPTTPQISSANNDSFDTTRVLSTSSSDSTPLQSPIKLQIKEDSLVRNIDEESRMSFHEPNPPISFISSNFQDVQSLDNSEKLAEVVSTSNTSASSYSDLSTPGNLQATTPGLLSSVEEKPTGSPEVSNDSTLSSARISKGNALTTIPGLIVRSSSPISQAPNKDGFIIKINKKYFKNNKNSKKGTKRKVASGHDTTKRCNPPKKSKHSSSPTKEIPTTSMGGSSSTLVTKTISKMTTSSEMLFKGPSSLPFKDKEPVKEGIKLKIKSHGEQLSSISTAGQPPSKEFLTTSRSKSTKRAPYDKSPSKLSAKKAKKTPAKNTKRMKTEKLPGLTVNTLTVKQVSPLVMSSKKVKSPSLIVHTNPIPESSIRQSPGLTITATPGTITRKRSEPTTKAGIKQLYNHSTSSSSDEGVSDDDSSSLSSINPTSDNAAGLSVTTSLITTEPLHPKVEMIPNAPILYYCPICRQPDDGRPMVACDACEDMWFHWHCVGITEPPSEDQEWFCPDCLKKKGKKRKRAK